WRRRLGLLPDAVESRGERRGEGEVGVRVGAGGAALDAQRLARADDPESRGAVVVAPSDAGRRERSGNVAFVRRRIGRIEREHLANVRHPSAQEVAERLRLAGEERLLPGLVPKTDVNVAARSRVALVPLGHERDRLSVLPGDLFRGVLVDVM